jgi:hypothetical protein
MAGSDTATKTSSSSNPPFHSLDWWAATKASFESGALQIGKQASAIARGLIATT